MTTARITSCVPMSGASLDHGRGSVSDDLGHGLTQLGRVEPHHHHGVGPHRASVLNHAVDRVAASVLDQAGVLDDLATSERPQAGHDVSTEAPAAHHDPEDLAESLFDVVARRP